MKAFFAIVVLAFALGAAGWYMLSFKKLELPAGAPQPATFIECAKYFPVQEWYPRRCTNGIGVTTIEDIGNALDMKDKITVSSPLPNDTISSPVFIRGQALGDWFEVSTIKLKILDKNEKVLGDGFLETTKYPGVDTLVPFEGTIAFSVPRFGSSGTIVIHKANSSEELRIPVLLK